MTPAQARIKAWREDPCRFVSDVFGVTPDAWQAKALRAFGSQDDRSRRISLQACAGPGKTAVLAWMGWNFLLCYGEKGDHPKGAAVSITATNLSDNLWPEFSKWQERSEILRRAFTWTKSRIQANDHPSTWFLAARSFSKTANAEEQGRTLSGLHGKYVLALIDESGDIPPAVLKAAEQALSTAPGFGKIVQAGNPTSHEGMLYAVATVLSHQWTIVRITGDPDDPYRSPRIGLDWAREQIATYGRENPWVMAFVLGKFPPTSVNSLLGPDDVATAMRRAPREESFSFSQKRLGVDVARFGPDRTVLFPRQGLIAFEPVVLRGLRTEAIVGRILKARVDWGQELELVDGSGGFGAGVIDGLLQAGGSPIEVQFSGVPNDPRYFNKRSEIHFLMSEWVKRGGALPNRPGLAKELTAPTYYFQGGKLRLEEKDQIKKRLGFSPDEADALALTFSLPDMPASLSALTGLPIEQSNHRSDYDPFADRD